jgi:uncharacterized membrane protein YfcA
MLTALIGILIGLAVGLTGVGGGTLTVPALIIILGMPAAEAVGTALLYVTITKVFAVPVYWSRGQVDLTVLGRLLLGGLPGVIGGAWLLDGMNTERLTPVILAVVGLTIVSLASVSLWKLFRKPPVSVYRPRALGWLALPIGVEVGFSSAGAGALGSLLLQSCAKITPAVVIGTDLLFGLILSAAGGLFHLSTGTYNGQVLTLLAPAGVIGALAGAALGTKLPAKPLRATLNVTLVIVGGNLCYKGLRLLF